MRTKWDKLLNLFCTIQKLVNTGKYTIFWDGEFILDGYVVIDNPTKVVSIVSIDEERKSKYTFELFNESELVKNYSVVKVEKEIRERLVISSKIKY